MSSTVNGNQLDAPPLVRGMTWEEMTVGMRFRTASRTITEADLVAFITLCGFNEPLFWDAEHAATAGYAGRLVPGALTYAMAEGLVIQSHALHGTGLAFMHMELDVRRPVLVGDTISAVTVFNQRGEDVLAFTPVRLIRGRDYVEAQKEGTDG